MGHAYDPVVTPEGLRWREYEIVADLPADDEDSLDWFDRPGRPPPLDDARPYDVPGGLARPDPQDQSDLAQAVPDRFTDPRTGWGNLLNAGGPPVDPFRSANALDCALSALATWHGEPTVAAPRRPEYGPGGHPVVSGEAGGIARAERWIGHRFEGAGHGEPAYRRVAGRLAEGGHGSAAVLLTRWAAGGCHAWNAFVVDTEIVWADLQQGTCATRPPYPDAAGVFAACVRRGGGGL